MHVRALALPLEEFDSDTKPESIINQRENMLFQISIMSVIWIYMVNDCYSINCPNRTVQT